MGPATDATLGALARKVFSFPVFLGALLVAGMFMNLHLRLGQAAELPAGHWHATFVEGDTFWHIAAGQRILETHQWPTTNFYSFTTPTSEWLAYEWLGEVLMALASDCGGPRALMALLALLVSAIMLLLYYYASLVSGDAKSAFIACVAALPLLGFCFTLRPQLLGYTALLITLILLERYRRGLQKSLWVLAPVFVLWVNTHGTFTLGLAAMAIYWVAGLKGFRVSKLEGKAWLPRERWHLAWVFLLCVVALTVNPYGPHLIRYELGIASQPVNLKYFEDWQPLGFHDFYGVWFLILLSVLVIGWFFRRRAERAEAVVLVIFAAVLACIHQRFAVFFAIALAPVLAELLAEWTPAHQPEAERPALNAILILAFVVGGVVWFPSSVKLQRLIDRNQPSRAVNYLRTHSVPEPMFNDNFWGGYLIWAFQGQHKVFIDGRSDAYEPSGVLADYVRIIQAEPDALAVLKKYGVRSCLIERNGSLANLLDGNPEWRQVYQDDLSVLLVRQEP